MFINIHGHKVELVQDVQKLNLHDISIPKRIIQEMGNNSGNGFLLAIILSLFA